MDYTQSDATQEGRPLHLQVKDAISANLRKGTWKPGDQLPTEMELSRQYRVSEGTVRHAVIALVKEGRLTRRSGKGTFVARPNFERSFARFFRFRGSAEVRDADYAVAVLDIKTGTVSDRTITAALGLSASAKVISLHRAIKQNGTVVCHYVSYLSGKEFGSLCQEDLEDVALYDVLETKFKVHVVRVVETLRARVADAQDAAVLGVRLGEPVISVERLAYTYGDRVAEVRRTVGRSDNFSYQIQLS